MITNKYKYPELKRIENILGRFYIDPENNVKINTFTFPYFFKNFPEKTVKTDAEITPIEPIIELEFA